MVPRSIRIVTICFLLVSLVQTGDASEAEPTFSPADLEYFEREVRPILARRCYECHSGETAEPKGGLRLDSRSLILAGGDTGPAIVPGDPADSLLIDAINYGDIYQMPPKTKLPPEEVATLAQWVQRGAPWPPERIEVAIADRNFDLAARKASHWCWQPPQRVLPPAVRDSTWPQQDWDAFILDRLEQEQLTPAAPADRRTLIRRVYFDLLGLPPTAEAVEAFVADTAPRAFARLVDQLLQSPRFGERWARHWLDLVRYAETHGHEFDYPIAHASRYRDYLIRALNADVPYDELIVEHLAGDLLEAPRRNPVLGFNESVIGTGFWWLGEATHAPVDVRDDEARRIDNQIDVMTKAFLGLTVACARCHDHKFDAISTKDYYSLAGYLQSSRRHEAWLDPHGRIAEVVRQLERLQLRRSHQFAKAVSAAAPSGEEIATHLRAVFAAEVDKQTTASVAAKFRLDAEQLERWRSVFRDRSADFADGDLTRGPLFLWGQLLRGDRPLTEIIESARQRTKEAHATNAQSPLFVDFQLGWSDWDAAGPAFATKPVAPVQVNRTGTAFLSPTVANSGRLADGLQGVLRSPTFTLEHSKVFYKISGTQCQVRLILDGYFMDVFNPLLFKGFTEEVDASGGSVWLEQGRDVGRYLGHRAYLEVVDHGAGAFSLDAVRFSNGPAPEVVPHAVTEEILEQFPAMGTPEQLAHAYGTRWEQALGRLSSGTSRPSDLQLLNWMLEQQLVVLSAAAIAERDRLAAKHQQLAASIPKIERVLAMRDGSPENEHVFIRGNYRTSGEEAPRAMLTALRDEPPQNHRGSGRLDLARQIADPDNALTARVAVNRLWHHLFGQGLVPSVDNFGVLGELPSHPELLDYLAIEFTRRGWSIKRMLRLLVLSSTYQMGSEPSPLAESKDPKNRLLHRMPVRRLEAEAIRDAILAVSGELDTEMFGDSVGTHVTPFMQGRGRPRTSGPLDGHGRRSIYLEVRRNFLAPMMLAFDAPIPFNTMGRRNRSNVPAQALILMNDPFVMDQAEKWAQRLMDRNESDRKRVRRMYLAAFARPPADDELQRSLQFLKVQAAELRHASNHSSLHHHVWSDLAHVLFNAKEFIFIR